MKKARKLCAIALSAVTLLSLCACGKEAGQPADEPIQSNEPELSYEGASIIHLDGASASIDDQPIEEFDYTWHCDPGVSHDEVKNAPAEYYTGEKPETAAAAYIDHELYYYPLLPEEGFELINYDGEREWAYYYTDGEHGEFIFATLPRLGNSLPTQMMHSEAEAAENKVLHITKPGTYVLEGSWRGQIRVELGDKDEAFTDENAKITLILGGVDINCSVAPGIVFYSAYECDNGWEGRQEWSAEVDTAEAGVNVIIADGSENTVSGTNIYRMLKTKYKDEDSTAAVKTQKKQRKLDGAFYSYVTMNISGGQKGNGRLTVNSGFEGIDSELHLSFKGGNVTINSQDDGINVNEDNVSVVSFSGGSVVINAGLGAEGDGVDSNGFVVIDGGSVSVSGVTPPDSAIDSDSGIYYKSGTVTIDGEEQSYNAGDVFRETGGGPGGMGGPGGKGEFGGMTPPDGGGFGAPGMTGGNFDIKDFKEKVAALDDSATLEDVLALLGFDNFRGGQTRPDMP